MQMLFRLQIAKCVSKTLGVAAAVLIVAVAICTLLLAGPAAVAQNSNATIRGQIVDSSGAYIPGAKVTILNKNTGTTVYSGVSDPSGVFVSAEVVPGTYHITVDAAGFKELIVDNVIATVAQVATVNAVMQVGSLSEAVTVTSKEEGLDSSTSQISTLISPAEVQNAPLLNRAPEDLLAFIPGVAHGGAADTVSTGTLSVNGSRSNNSDILINGVSIVIASTGSALTLPSPDGIDQLRLLATNAPAEYGRTAGAILSTNTLSGTNQLHGNLYYLMRNEDFDANNYFNKLKIVNGAVTPRAKDRYFQFGGSLGGPVEIPRLYNGRDKTFFFVNYDYTIAPNIATFTDTVPTAAMRTGNLAAALATTGLDGNPRTPVPVYMPTGTNSPVFPQNLLTGIDPAAANIFAQLPLPNTQGTFDKTNNRYTGNWFTQQNLQSHTLRLVARVDEQITPKDRLSANVYRYTTMVPQGVNYNETATGSPLDFSNALFNTTWDCSCGNGWVSSLEYTRTWTPTLLMDLNMGFFRFGAFRNPPSTNLNAATATDIATLPLNQMPELTSVGLSNIGSDANTNQKNITNTLTPFGSITKIIGPHTLKVGASLRKNQFNSYNPASSPEGTLSFDGSVTNHGNAGNATTSVADFLLGKIKTGSYEQPQPETGRRNWNLGVFAEDTFRAAPKLTLNLGVRWEYESPLTLAHNVYSRFDPTTGLMLVAGVSASPSLNINTPKNDVSPRLGFAYSVDQNTVIRGAFGTFFGTIFQNLGGQIAFPGYDNNISYNNLGTAIAQPFTLSQGFPLSPALVGGDPRTAPLYVNATDSNPYAITGIEFNFMSKMPVVEQWNLGVQHAFPLGVTMEVNYIGNHAVHLPYNVPVNVVPLSAVPAVTLTNTTKATQDARPFPTLTSWTTVDQVGNSNYNALQVTVRRDFSRQLAILSNYTYAKSEDDGSSIYSTATPFAATANAQYAVDGPSRARDFTISNFDVKHTLNILMIYTTTGPRWLRGLHIAPAFVGHTGLPYNITQTTEISNATQQRPNGDPRGLKLAHPFVNGAVLQYLDSPVTDPAFPLTPSGPVYNTINGVRTQILPTGFGTVGRDSNRAPGEINLDGSVSKDIQLYRELKFQLRVDAFNVLNHTNFQQPASTLTVSTATNSTIANFVSSTSFGQITGTQPSRRLQVSARFFF